MRFSESFFKRREKKNTQHKITIILSYDIELLQNNIFPKSEEKTLAHALLKLIMLP